MSGSRRVFGLHAVAALLEKNAQSVLELSYDARRRDTRLAEILVLAERAGLAAKPLERSALDALAPGANHQGVIAEVRETAAQDESALYARLEALQVPPLLLVLDGVQDPHNLGACLRSADAVGVHAVIAPRDRACGLTAAVRKVACGAAESVPFYQVTNLARTLRRLKAEGVWLVGLAGDVDSSLFQVDLSGPLALVLGAEGKGLRRLTREQCDLVAALPMSGAVSSLNVSVAAGVCLYEAWRQRCGPV